MYPLAGAILDPILDLVLVNEGSEETDKKRKAKR